MWWNKFGAWVTKMGATFATVWVLISIQLFFQICFLNLSNILTLSLYRSSGSKSPWSSTKFWIHILEMFNKSLLHIIFNNWTFIDLMSNIMIVYVAWRVRSWNYVHIMDYSTPIPWDFSNNAFVVLIKSRFIIPYSDSHMYTFYYYYFSI